MIRFDIQSSYIEALDGRDTKGQTVLLQIGRLVITFSVSWGRR